MNYFTLLFALLSFAARDEIAWADETPVSGWIDNVSTQSGIEGWACQTGTEAPVDVHIYVGGEAGQPGAQFLTVTKANIIAEPGVAAGCGTQGTAHRFHLPWAGHPEWSKYAGQPVVAHMIAIQPSLDQLRANLAYSVDSRTRLALLYQSLLGREPTPAELAAGQLALSTGKTPDDLRKQAIDSKEFNDKLTNAFGVAGKSDLMNLLVGGVSVATLWKNCLKNLNGSVRNFRDIYWTLLASEKTMIPAQAEYCRLPAAVAMHWGQDNPNVFESTPTNAAAVNDTDVHSSVDNLAWVTRYTRSEFAGITYNLIYDDVRYARIPGFTPDAEGGWEGLGKKGFWDPVKIDTSAYDAKQTSADPMRQGTAWDRWKALNTQGGVRLPAVYMNPTFANYLDPEQKVWFHKDRWPKMLKPELYQRLNQAGVKYITLDMDDYGPVRHQPAPAQGGGTAPYWKSLFNWNALNQFNWVGLAEDTRSPASSFWPHHYYWSKLTPRQKQLLGAFGCGDQNSWFVSSPDLSNGDGIGGGSADDLLMHELGHDLMESIQTNNPGTVVNFYIEKFSHDIEDRCAHFAGQYQSNPNWMQAANMQNAFMIGMADDLVDSGSLGMIQVTVLADGNLAENAKVADRISHNYFFADLEPRYASAGILRYGLDTKPGVNPSRAELGASFVQSQEPWYRALRKVDGMATVSLWTQETRLFPSTGNWFEGNDAKADPANPRQTYPCGVTGSCFPPTFPKMIRRVFMDEGWATDTGQSNVYWYRPDDGGQSTLCKFKNTADFKTATGVTYSAALVKSMRILDPNDLVTNGGVKLKNAGVCPIPLN